jgi:hypothetical protein
VHNSSQSFVSEAVSSIRNGTGSRLALAAMSRTRRWASGKVGTLRRAAPAFSVTLVADRCLAIDDAAGCRLRVVDGEVWVTVEGSLRDVIARPGEIVALPCGVRVNVSAFSEAALLVTAPEGDVVFALSDQAGSQILTVTAGTPSWKRAVRETGAALMSFARRRFVATLAAI